MTSALKSLIVSFVLIPGALAQANTCFDYLQSKQTNVGSINGNWNSILQRRDIAQLSSEDLKKLTLNKNSTEKEQLGILAIQNLLIYSLRTSFFDLNPRYWSMAKDIESGRALNKATLADYRIHILQLIEDTDLNPEFLKNWRKGFIEKVANFKTSWSNSRDANRFSEKEWNEVYESIRLPEVLFYNIALSTAPFILRSYLSEVDRRIHYSDSGIGPLPGLLWIGAIFGGPHLLQTGNDGLAVAAILAGVGIPLGIFVYDWARIFKGDSINQQIKRSNQILLSVLKSHSQELVQYSQELAFYRENQVKLIWDRIEAFRQSIQNVQAMEYRIHSPLLRGKINQLMSGVMLSASFFTEHPFFNPRRISVERLKLALALDLKMNDLSKEDSEIVEAELETMKEQIELLDFLRRTVADLNLMSIENSGDLAEGNEYYEKEAKFTSFVNLQLMRYLEVQLRIMQQRYDEAASTLNTSSSVLNYLNSSQAFRESLEQISSIVNQPK